MTEWMDTATRRGLGETGMEFNLESGLVPG